MMLTNLALNAWTMPMLHLAAGGGPAAAAGDEHGAASTVIEPSAAQPFLFGVVEIGVVTLVLGLVLCLYRLLRGPHLADRVLAGDAFGLHVVGLVILLTIYMGNTVFFDAALVVAIIGFASTLAFAQYIGTRGGHAEAASAASTPSPSPTTPTEATPSP